MKIRINGNSVRLRLSKSEVEHFGKEGRIESSTSFGGSIFHYVLSKTADDKMTANFENNTITVYLPETLATTWVNTEKVGYDANMDIGGGDVLYLLLEKDFKCLDNSIEDQGDNYDNPLAAQFKTS